MTQNHYAHWTADDWQNANKARRRSAERVRKGIDAYVEQMRRDGERLRKRLAELAA